MGSITDGMEGISEDAPPGTDSSPPSTAEIFGNDPSGENASSCWGKFGFTDADAIQTENEGYAHPFGTSPDGLARERAAGGGGGDSDTTAAPGNASVPVPVNCRSIPTGAPDSYQLGKHFTVGKLSSQAIFRHTIPSVTALGMQRSHVICNMLHLVTNCLDPLWEHYTNQGFRITLNSGFRNNTNGSDHNRGSAADLCFYKDGRQYTGADLTRICKEINESLKLPFTQMIHEANRVLHIACRPQGNSSTRIFWSSGFGSPVSGVGYRHRV